MGFFKRLAGICETIPPSDRACWARSNDHLEIDLERAPELGAPGGAIRLEADELLRRYLELARREERRCMASHLPEGRADGTARMPGRGIWFDTKRLVAQATSSPRGAHHGYGNREDPG